MKNYIAEIIYPETLNNLDNYRKILIALKENAAAKLYYANEFCTISFDKKNPNSRLSINGESDNLIGKKNEIWMLVMFKDLGMIIQTANYYFVSYDMDLYKSKTIIWTKNNFSRLRQKVTTWINNNTNLSLYYIRPNGVNGKHQTKKVFYLVDEIFYHEHFYDNADTCNIL